MTNPPLSELGANLPTTDEASLDRLRRFGGGKLLNQMIALFLTAGPERIGAARAGLAAGDAKAVEMALHAFKSSSAQLGAMQLQRLCERGEHTTRGGSLETIDTLVELIADEFARVHIWLDGARNPETA